MSGFLTKVPLKNHKERRMKFREKSMIPSLKTFKLKAAPYARYFSSYTKTVGWRFEVKIPECPGSWRLLWRIMTREWNGETRVRFLQCTMDYIGQHYCQLDSQTNRTQKWMFHLYIWSDWVYVTKCYQLENVPVRKERRGNWGGSQKFNSKRIQERIFFWKVEMQIRISSASSADLASPIVHACGTSAGPRNARRRCLRRHSVVSRPKRWQNLAKPPIRWIAVVRQEMAIGKLGRLRLRVRTPRPRFLQKKRSRVRGGPTKVPVTKKWQGGECK